MPRRARVIAVTSRLSGLAGLMPAGRGGPIVRSFRESFEELPKKRGDAHPPKGVRSRVADAPLPPRHVDETARFQAEMEPMRPRMWFFLKRDNPRPTNRLGQFKGHDRVLPGRKDRGRECREKRKFKMALREGFERVTEAVLEMETELKEELATMYEVMHCGDDVASYDDEVFVYDTF